MLNRSAFRKSILFSALSLLVSAPTAFSDVAPVTVSSVQSASNTGAATTSIPIDVPPGRKGIQPNLALTYNSNSPNGWLGVGWSLDMGAIQRATKRGLDYNGNNYVFSSGGGSSELVVRGDWGSNYYGAKTEGAFSKYYFDSSTGGWIVTTKDGTKYYYGTTENSRQYNPNNSAQVFKWLLYMVVDTNGNYMTVSYSPLDNGERYLNEIQYTGNTGGLSPTNSVKFYLEARTDAPAMYTSNVQVRTYYRLKTIDIWAKDASGVNKRSRAYKLSYSTSASTNRALLTAVQQFGTDATLDGSNTVTGGSSLPAQSIQYLSGGTTVTSSANYAGCNSSGVGYCVSGRTEFISGDFNGDGKADVFMHERTGGGEAQSYGLAFGNGDGTFTNAGNYVGCNGPLAYCVAGNTEFIAGDYNGDGKTDLFLHNRTGGGEAQYYGLVQGNGSYFTNVGNYLGCAGPMSYCVAGNTEFIPGDYNGDGKTDLFLHNRTGGGEAQYYGLALGNGSYFTNVGNYLGSNGPLGYSVAGNTEFVPGDYNGDGKTDLFIHNRTGGGEAQWYGLAVANETYFSNVGNYLGCAGPMGYCIAGNTEFIPGDYNGDGKTDLLIHQWTGGNEYQYYGLAVGNGTYFSNMGNYLGCAGSLNYCVTGNTEFIPGDYNGDGKTDLFIHYRTGGSEYQWYGLAISNGTSFSNAQNYSGCNGPLSYCVSGNTEFISGDYNGDGKTDLFAHYRTGGSEYQLYGLASAQGGPADLLSTIANGLGATTTITYKPSSSYTNGLLPFVVQTVSSVGVHDGIVTSTTSTTNYTYSGGLYDQADREFRGFSYVKATAPNSTTTETWFKQDAVYKGLPYDQIVKDSSGNTYSRTVSSYLSATPYTGVSFPYLSQRDDYVYDGGTTYKRLTTGFTYDSYGNLTRKYHYGDAAVSGDERDENIEYGYDTTNWIVSLPSHTWVLDSGGVKKAEGWFGYDPKGNLLTETRWLSGGTNPVITYTYDSYGNRATVKDAKNNTTTIAYDTVAQTYPVTISNALGHSATKTYDYRYGKPLIETDANGNATSYIYDVFGRVTKVTGPLDTGSTYGTVTYSYDSFGTVGSQKVSTYRTEQGGTSNYIWEENYFDGLGRTFKTRREGPDSKVIVQQSTIDKRGLVTAKSLPYFGAGLETPRWTTFDYDAVGRVIKATNPDSTYATTAYDKGRTTITNANGQQKVEEKDVYGRLVKVEEYNGGSPYATTAYQYDVMGNLTGTTDAKGNQSVINYDTLGRKTSMNDPDMGTWTYAYDANGNLTSQTDAKGQTITFAYDALNRITLKDYPAGAGTDAVYTYDETSSTNGKGRLTTLVDASGTGKYWYDAMGRATKSTRTIDSVAYTTETAYDALSRITSVKYPDNETVTYSYDAGGNLSQIGSYGTYGNYNALGQAGTITYANGVTTTYVYHPDNKRLTSINTAKGATGLINQSYGYDNVGNITGITDNLNSSRIQTFGYDHLNRLTQAASTAYGTLAYSYNEIGNMTAKEGVTYTYPANGSARPHAVTATSDGKSYTYDNNGNMTSDGLRTIAYDYDNMPSSVTLGATTTSFVYDASGQRVKKITPTATTVYVGKLYECVGTSCTKYIMANGNKLAWKNSAGTFYYHQDHLGSSRVITDATGAKAEEITYLPYGATLTDSGNGTVSVEHRFTSQAYDAETGLYYYGARYYNPGLGRFVSADSIVTKPSDPQDLNRYTYAGNNPLLYTDPTGHSKLSKGLKKLQHYVRQHNEFFAVVSPNLYAYGQSPQHYTQFAIAAATYYVGGSIIAGLNNAGFVLSAGAKAGIHAAVGAVSGGVSSSINHTDIGQGMLAGAIAGGISSYAGGYIPKGFGYQLAGRTLIGGVTGGISAEIYGGKFRDGFVRGGITAAAEYLFNACAHGCIELSGNKGSAIIIQGNSLYNEKYSYVQDGQLKDTLIIKEPTFFKVATDFLQEVVPTALEEGAKIVHPALGLAVKVINFFTFVDVAEAPSAK